MHESWADATLCIRGETSPSYGLSGRRGRHRKPRLRGREDVTALEWQVPGQRYWRAYDEPNDEAVSSSLSFFRASYYGILNIWGDECFRDNVRRRRKRTPYWVAQALSCSCNSYRSRDQSAVYCYSTFKDSWFTSFPYDRVFDE